MGYSVIMVKSSFLIGREHESAALEAIHQLDARQLYPDD
jgi:hypothetical protein